MFHASIHTASAIVLMASASAQNGPQTLDAERIPGAIKHAGTYHLSTGTWTRSGGAVGNFGPDTIYSNTAQSGYFSATGGNGGALPGGLNFDEGSVPSSTNTNHPNANRNTYTVNCIEIGYCDLDVGGPSSWELSFHSAYQPCTFDGTADARMDTGSLPANGCWTMALDLSGGNEFCLTADGGDGFDDDEEHDSFGWSFRYTGTSTAPAGFFLTGDPRSTDAGWVVGALPTEGTNTYFGSASPCSPDVATGLLTQDSWFLEDPNDPDPGGPTSTSNCYWFGGYRNNNGCGGPSNPYASFYMELQADITACDNPCLCVPNGCLSNPNSTGVNSTMLATGSTSIAANDLTLTASVTVDSFGFFITARTAGFIVNPGGSEGNICLGGSVGRFSNLASSSGPTGTIEISTASGQWSLSSIPQGSGPYAAQVGGVAHFQCWHRDSAMGVPTSNFTDGIVVTWTP